MPRPVCVLALSLSSLLVAVSLHAAEGFQVPPEVPTVEALTFTDFEAHVRSSYALAEEYSQRSNQPVSFQLSDFETRPMAAVESEPYADLATLPDGWTLALLRKFHTDWDRGERTLTYVYKWEQLDTDWTAFPEGRMMLSESVSEVFAKVAQHLPEYRATQHVTQFTVVAEHADRRRQYTAAFLWIPAEISGSWHAIPNDHIVQGLETVTVERLPPGGILLETPDVGSPASRTMDPRTGVSETRPNRTEIAGLDQFDGEFTCETDQAQEDVSKAAPPGTNGHLAGAHTASIDLTFDCSCNSECTSQCDAGWDDVECSENRSTSVIWNACHKMKQAVDFSTTGQSNAMVDGARCAGALSCQQKSCLFCSCGLTAGVEVVGASVEYDSSDADWTANLKGAWTCGRCKEVDPPSSGGSGTGEEAEFSCETFYSCVSPILISMNDARFLLTSPADGVAFDLNADGVLDQTSWTTPGTDEAFLAMDRNGNGLIDNGRELFGDSTQQAPSDDRNGFRALAWYDQLHRGGNEDRWISAEDRVFEVLVVWQDANHDGISQANELTPLQDTHIVGIDLDYFISGRRDRHGNQFRWTSMVEFDDGRHLRATDAIFMTADGN